MIFTISEKENEPRKPLQKTPPIWKPRIKENFKYKAFSNNYVKKKRIQFYKIVHGLPIVLRARFFFKC